MPVPGRRAAATSTCSTSQGKPLGEVKLPGIGTVAGFGGDQDDTETFYTFTSYNTPPSVYRYDVPANKSRADPPAEGEVQSGRLRGRAGVLQEQGRHARADDPRLSQGPRPLDRPQPTLLYGYGGFNISLPPAFSADYIAWMEMGGVFAVANLRGGGEYGEDWHQAGKNLKKQNVFDDFIAAAEWLIAKNYTHARQAGHHGRQQRRAAGRRGR